MADDTARSAPDLLEYSIDSRRARVVGWSFIAMTVAVFLLFVVVLAIAPHVSSFARAVMVPAYVIVGVLSVTWLVRRLLRATVTANRTGLYVYNGLHTYVVPWRDVDGFTDAFQPFLMAVERRHGRKITLAAVMGATWTDRALQHERIGELEAFWRRMVADAD